MADFDPRAHLAALKQENAGVDSPGADSSSDSDSSAFDPKAHLAKLRSENASPAPSGVGGLESALRTAGSAGLSALGAVGRTVDRFTGAPTRAALGAALDARSPLTSIPDAVSAGLKQFGANPDQAPTGQQLAVKMGVPNQDYQLHSKEPLPSDPDFFRYNNDPTFRDNYIKSGPGSDYTVNPSRDAGVAVDLAANPANFTGLGELGEAGSLTGELSALGRKGVAKTSEFLSGSPSEAVERLIQRPGQVLNAEKEGNSLNVARKARDELLARDASEDAAIRDARKGFRENYGQTPMDNSDISKDMREFTDKNAPNPQGLGPVPGDELDHINKLADSIESMNAGDLQKTADYIDNQVKNFEQSKMPGSGDTRYQAYLRSLRGKVKDKLHEIDPDGLGAADERFHDYATKAGRIGKLEDENQMESFINNYFGKNKTLMRESAQDLIPNSVDDIADIGASRAFTKQGPAGSEMGGRRIVGSGLGTILMGHGMMTHNPTEMVAGAASHLLTSPEVHKQVIGRASQAMDAIGGSKWFQAMKDNPALLDSISSPELKKILGNMLEQQRGVPAYAKGQSDREPAQSGSTYDPNQYLNKDDAKNHYLQGN